MKHLFNVLLLSLLLASPAVQASDTPESVARAYIAAINANGMEAGADFFHPDEQKRLKDMLQPVYDAIPEDDPRMAWVMCCARCRPTSSRAG